MMGRLRLCHVITMLELGGAQELTLDTLERLDRARFEPSLLAGPGGLLDERARRIDGLRFETVPHLVREIRPAKDARALAELVERLRAIAPDIVHTNSSKAGVLGRAAASLAGVPVIVHTVHGWGFHPWQRAWVRSFYAQLERAASVVTTQWIAVSESNARSGAAHDIAPFEAFAIVNPGVHTGRFSAGAGSGRLRAELGLTPAAPLLGTVSCLKPQKAPLDFVAVAARVLDAIPEAHAVLAGDGALRGEVERAAAAAGIAGRVHLLGWRDDPETVVGDLDLFLLTSLHEGLPMVIAEAMAAGKPVVATAVDGTPEVVRDGETGYLHAPHDVEGLAASSLALLRDPARARRMGEAGRRAARRFDVDRMVERLASLYTDLAARAPSGRAARA